MANQLRLINLKLYYSLSVHAQVCVNTLSLNVTGYNPHISINSKKSLLLKIAFTPLNDCCCCIDIVVPQDSDWRTYTVCEDMGLTSTPVCPPCQSTALVRPLEVTLRSRNEGNCVRNISWSCFVCSLQPGQLHSVSSLEHNVCIFHITIKVTAVNK